MALRLPHVSLPGPPPGVSAALKNVLTLGESQHPGGLAAYGREQASMLDPRTKEGIFNIGMALVPGGGKLPPRYMAKADLETTLAKAGVQPSSWVTRPDPLMDALRARAGNKSQGGVTHDPDSASKFYGRAGGYGAEGLHPYVAKAVGPRRVGGIYRGGYGNEAYRVLDIRHSPEGNWQIKVEPLEPSSAYDRPRWHATAWAYGQDQVLHQPPGASPTARTYLEHLLQTRYNPNIHKPGG